MMKSIIIVGVGGFIGSALRFVISRHFQVYHPSLFPWGTFFVNIVGSFLIGILYGIAEKGEFMSQEWRTFLAVGFCGGFTTFSSLSLDAFLLAQNNEWFRFTVYSGLSFSLGLLTVYAGRSLIKIL